MADRKFPALASCGTCSLNIVLPIHAFAKTREKVSSFLRSTFLSMALATLVAGCSHFDPYENVGEIRAHDDKKRLFPKEWKESSDSAKVSPAFVGSLPAALKEAEELRLALIQTSANMSSERALYDAALWTLTPYMLYRASANGLQGSAKDDVMGAALVLGAGYGYLNSRPKAYEQIYLQGTKRLTCLMVEYTQFLYTNEEFCSNAAANKIKSVRSQQDSLANAIDEYEKKTQEIALDILRSKPLVKHTCAAKTTVDCQTRKTALRKTEPDRSILAANLQNEAAQQIHKARQTLREISALVSNIEIKAANSLRISSQLIMTDLTAELQSNRPDLTSVTNATSTMSASIKDLSEQMATAQSSLDEIKSRSIFARRALKALPPGTLELPFWLDPDVTSGMRDAEMKLSAEIAATQMILDTHQKRVDEIEKLKTAMACELTYPLPGKDKPATGTRPTSTETQLPR